MLDYLWPHGLQPTRLPCPWDSPAKNTEEGCHALLQVIFLSQGLYPGLLHCRRILYCLSHWGSSKWWKGAWLTQAEETSSKNIKRHERTWQSENVSSVSKRVPSWREKRLKRQTKSRPQRTFYTTYHSPTFTLQKMVGHQRLCIDCDMIKFALQKDNTDRNRDSRLERRAQQIPLFSALMLTNSNKNKWLYVLFKRHMLNCQVKTTKSWLYTKDLQDSVKKKDHKQDYWTEFKVTFFFLIKHSYSIHPASHIAFCCHKQPTLGSQYTTPNLKSEY